MIYLTGAQTYLAEQNNPSKSLGGFTSSTPVDNGTVDNLFEQLINQSSNDYRMIVFENVNDKAINVRVWTQTKEESVCTYQLAGVKGYKNQCGEIKFEQIKKGTSKPFQGNFKVHEEYTPLTTLLNPQEQLGIWVNRKFEYTPPTEGYDDGGSMCEEIQDNNLSLHKITEERFSLIIETD